MNRGGNVLREQDTRINQYIAYLFFAGHILPKGRGRMLSENFNKYLNEVKDLLEGIYDDDILRDMVQNVGR